MAALPERWNAGLEILVRAWRQAALAGTAIVLAQMGNIALARIPGDRTTDRCLARGQCCGKNQKAFHCLVFPPYTGELGSFGNRYA